MSPSPQIHVVLDREEAERLLALIGMGLEEDTVETPAPFALKTARAKLRATLDAEEGEGYALVIGRLEGALSVVEGEGDFNREGLAEILREAIGASNSLRQDRADLLAVLFQPESVRKTLADRILEGDPHAG
jgi:hypothetical protein